MKIVAFVDTSLYAQSVIDHTAWLAADRGASIELVQVISPGELMTAQLAPMHPSVSIPLDSKRVDDEVAALKRHGERQLEAAREQLAATGLNDVRVRLVEGNIATLMQEAVADAMVAVMGKRGENADLARLQLGSHVERLVRSTSTPVLAVSRSFRPIERMLLPMDAGDSSAVAALLAGVLPRGAVELLHVGEATEPVRAALAAAGRELAGAGFSVGSQVVGGDPRLAIPERVVLERFDLLALGSFRSLRIKSLLLGSLTAELARACLVPILLC